MIDKLTKLGEMGAVVILALVLLLAFISAIVLVYLFLFKAVPRMHGEAMQKVTLITGAINQNTEEIRTSRRDSETRHDLIVVHLDRITRKQDAMHNDFLSEEPSKKPTQQRREQPA